MDKQASARFFLRKKTESILSGEIPLVSGKISSVKFGQLTSAMFLCLIFLLMLFTGAGLFAQPDPPSNLFIISQDKSNEIYWTASISGGVIEHRIYRSEDSVIFNYLSSVPIGTNTFTDNNVINSKFYFYKATAWDGLQESIIYSNTDASSPNIISSYLHFDGAGDYAFVEDVRTLRLPYPTPGFTVQCWVKVDATGGGERTILAREDNADAKTYYKLSYTIDRFVFQTPTYPTQSVESDPLSLTIEADKWYHIAVTFDDGGTTPVPVDDNTLSMYVNGNLVDQVLPPTVMLGFAESGASQTSRFVFGAEEDLNIGPTYTKYWLGAIAEVSLWNIALDQTVIQTQMDGRYRGDEAGLVGLWHFDDMYNNTIYNYSSVNDAMKNAIVVGNVTTISSKVIAENDTVSILASTNSYLNIRNNDIVYVAGSKIRTKIIEGPSNGSATVIDFDSISYNPGCFLGTDTIKYTINDTTFFNADQCADTAFVVITVQDNPPVITSDGGGTSAAISIDENTTAITTVTASVIDLCHSNNYSLSGGADLAKFSINGSSGILSFIVAPDFENPTDIGANNIYNVTVQVSDGFLTDTQAIVITVLDVNEAPWFVDNLDNPISFARDTLNEDYSPKIKVLVKDNESDALAFTSVTSLTGIGTINTVTMTDTSFIYNPDPDFNGYDTLRVIINDLGTPNLSDTLMIYLVILIVNDAPSYTAGANQSEEEDAGAQTVNNWATAISKGPANESSQNLTFTLTNNNTALFSAQPAIDASGNLTYTPAANINGSATIDVVLKDDGGTANGGIDSTSHQTFTITVNAVNDAPSYTAGANQAVDEDAGAQTVNNWATVISKGPANESSQNLTFTLTNNNTALFSAQPAIDASGNLTYTPAANINGSATIDVVLKDDGGTANGGVDSTSHQTFTITVNAVNDAPSYAAGANQAVDEDAGAQTVNNWATVISKGPAYESSQNLTFILTNNNNGLFSVQPAIDTSGNLTYTPAANINGSATIDVVLKDDGGTANGGVDSTSHQTFTITVNAVNDAPSYTAGANQAVDEDAGAQTVNNWATVISKGPANESSQNLTFILTNNNNGLFSVQPAIDTSGNLTYTPAANINGSATIDVVLKDDGGTANGGVDSTSHQTFTITVNAVNDAPSYTAGANQSEDEDSGAQTVNNWATAISKGPANESSQNLTFTLTNNNTTLFSAQPAIDASGNLTYTPAANINGSATIDIVLKDDGGTANGGIDSATHQTFTITVNAVNDAPSYTAGTNQSVDEDAGAQTVNNWATTISKGPANESSQNLTFTLTNNNTTLFSVQPAIDASGNLTYTPAANINASATIDVVLKDDGGTANGGVDSTSHQTFTITVNAVNDAPSYTAGANQSVDEDAGAQTVNNWATTISKGPANESSQNLTFTLTNNNTALFSVQPAIDASGNLTYTPAANINGSATIDVVLKDDGGTANGGIDSTSHQTFTITVNAVNDAPSFTKGADQYVSENEGALIVIGWATLLSRGPIDESAQSLTFLVTNNKNSLFVVQPAIDASGNLTYTPATDSSGIATVSIILKDNGGIANGGIDSTTQQTFMITVGSVNNAPSFTMGPDQVINEDAGAQTANNWATSISKGPSDESSQNITFTLTNNNTALFSAQPAIDASGNLTYTVAANVNGPAAIDVVLKDNGGTANGGIDSTVHQTFTLTVDAVNDAPSYTAGANQTVDEDAGVQTVNNWTTAISKGPANESSQNLTFTLTNNNTALFSVQPAIDASGNLTYTVATNTNGSATVDVVLKDNGGTSNGGVDSTSHITFTIIVNAVNDPPLNIDLTNSQVDENRSAGIMIGILSATDLDIGDSHTFAVLGIDAAFFTIAGDTLKTFAMFDYESLSSYSIIIRTTDSQSGTYEESFIITANDLNDAPTDIFLSNDHIDEGLPGGTFVGTLASTDQDQSDNHSYELVSGAGDTDNASFRIVGIVLRTDARFNYTIQNTFSIRVRTTDNGTGNLTFEKVLIITVDQVNNVPTGILLTQTDINENEPSGTVIGTLSTTDADAGNTHLYSILDGNDASSFSISGDMLLTAGSFNFEARSFYSITIRTTDNYGGTYDSLFVIGVNDLNEAPRFVDNMNNDIDILQYTLEAYDSLTVCPAIVDEDGNVTSYIYAGSLTNHGELSVVQGNENCVIFMPDTSFRGTDTTMLIAVDNGTPVLSDTLYIIFTVTEPYINHPPVITDETNNPADTLYYYTFINEELTICISAHDPDTDKVSFTGIQVKEGVAQIINEDTEALCFDIAPANDFIGQVIVSLTIQDDGSPALYDSVIILLLVEPKFEFSQAISPNGDGINDFLAITGIERFPDNELTIFNRWGDIVFKERGYDNMNDVWNGQPGNSANNHLPEGTYFYILEINGYGKPIKGFLVLKR